MHHHVLWQGVVHRVLHWVDTSTPDLALSESETLSTFAASHLCCITPLLHHTFAALGSHILSSPYYMQPAWELYAFLTSIPISNLHWQRSSLLKGLIEAAAQKAAPPPATTKKEEMPSTTSTAVESVRSQHCNQNCIIS